MTEPVVTVWFEYVGGDEAVIRSSDWPLLGSGWFVVPRQGDVVAYAGRSFEVRKVLWALHEPNVVRVRLR